MKENIIKAVIGFKNKDMILKKLSITRSGGTIKGVGFETSKKLTEFCAKSLSAQVDTVVTTAIHRLIRLPNTLHNKIRLKKVEFPISKIEDFDPFESAVAFKKGTATVLFPMRQSSSLTVRFLVHTKIKRLSYLWLRLCCLYVWVGQRL